MPLDSTVPCDILTSPQDAAVAQFKVLGPSRISLGSSADVHQADSSMHSNTASHRCDGTVQQVSGATCPSQSDTKSTPGPRQLLMAAASSCCRLSYALAILLIQVHAVLKIQPITSHPAQSAVCKPAIISRPSASVTTWLSSRWPALCPCSAPPCTRYIQLYAAMQL